MKHPYQENVMNDDIVIFNGLLCRVSIQGYQGSYRTIKGECINCAIGINGYITVLETTKEKEKNYPVGYTFRAEWNNRGLQMVKRSMEN